jgi:hypothetical protein
MLSAKPILYFCISVLVAGLFLLDTRSLTSVQGFFFGLGEKECATEPAKEVSGNTPQQANVSQKLSQVLLQARTRTNARCNGMERFTFEKYVPSRLEKWWNESIATVSKDWDKKGCPKVRADMERYKTWYYFVSSTQAMSVSDDEDVISYHVFRDLCSPEENLIKVPIEPLMGLLRHPNAICVSGSFGEVVRKDWLILPNLGYLRMETKPTVILYDLGASLYKSGAGGASQEWFVKEFAVRGLGFDDIFAWEAVVHGPKAIFKDVPKAMLHKLRYYNVPVEQEADALHNPLRVLKLSARPQDYVVVKLDIDTPGLELALMKQLLADPEALRLVDELFFEQHTGSTPMVRFWGRNVLGDVTDSYMLFAELRARGIRAHSWV